MSHFDSSSSEAFKTALPQMGTDARLADASLLRHADPAWLRRISSGMNWIVIGIVGYIALMILFMFAQGAAVSSSGKSGGAGGTGGPHSLSLTAINLLSLAFWLPMIAGNIGIWWVTDPEPNKDEWATVASANTASEPISGAGLNWRTVARGVSLPGSVLSVALSVIPFATGHRMTLAWFIAQMVNLFLSFVGAFCLATYLSQLARRMPNTSLARQTSVVKWAVSITIGIFLAVAAFDALIALLWQWGVLAPQQPVSLMLMMAAPIVVLGCVGPVVVIILGIWSLVLVMRYRSSFAAVAAVA